MLLSLNDIFSFAKCTSSSRNLIEGEQVINSNQVILRGKVQTENVSIHYLSNYFNAVSNS